MQFELAKWDVSFIPSLVENANDARIGRFLNTGFPYPYTADAAKKFVSAALNSPQDIHRAIVAGGGAVGCVSLCRGKGVLCRSAELGYWLAPAYWGRGIMTEAVGRMCAAAFAETDIVRIQAQVFAPNTASQKVLEKNGFAREAVLRRAVYKDGAFFDMFVYALLKPEEQAN